MWLKRTPTRVPVTIEGTLGFFRRISPFSDRRKSVATLNGKPSLSIQVTTPYLNNANLSGSTRSNVVKGQLPPRVWRYLRSSMQGSSWVLLRPRFFSRTRRIVPVLQRIRQCKAPSSATWEDIFPIHGQGQNH